MSEITTARIPMRTVQIWRSVIIATPAITACENDSAPSDICWNSVPSACMPSTSHGTPDAMPMMAAMVLMWRKLKRSARRSGCVRRSNALPHTHTGRAIRYISTTVRRL